jgi:hypothetical protein
LNEKKPNQRDKPPKNSDLGRVLDPAKANQAFELPKDQPTDILNLDVADESFRSRNRVDRITE